MAEGNTREQIMVAARARAQAQGYAALSFRELAKELGINSASIHYYFPTKGDLAAALARRYTEDAQVFFKAALRAEGELGPLFAQYIGIFRAALVNDNRMCLYGILSAERDELPPEVRVEVDGFLQANMDWLAAMLRRLTPGAEEGSVGLRALAIFAAIEGAQLVARGRGDISLFDQAIEGYRAGGLIPF